MVSGLACVTCSYLLLLYSTVAFVPMFSDTLAWLGRLQGWWGRHESSQLVKGLVAAASVTARRQHCHRQGTVFVSGEWGPCLYAVGKHQLNQQR